MSAEITDNRESVLLMAMDMLAKKYGCKLDIDIVNHTFDFYCPDKKVEADLAIEAQKILEGSEQG